MNHTSMALFIASGHSQMELTQTTFYHLRLLYTTMLANALHAAAPLYCSFNTTVISGSALKVCSGTSHLLSYKTRLVHVQPTMKHFNSTLISLSNGQLKPRCNDGEAHTTKVSRCCKSKRNNKLSTNSSPSNYQPHYN